MKVNLSTINIGALAAAVFTLAACNASTEPKGQVPVRFQLAARTVSAGAPAAATGSLEISALQMVVGRASLGGGEQFGCADCNGNFSDDPMTAKLVSLAAGGGRVDVATEQVSPGRYAQAEISLEMPSAATLAGVTDWPAGTSLRIVGRFNGVPFQVALAIQGTFRASLNPPLDVAAGATTATISVLVTLPVDGWFVSNGATLNPAKPGDRALIEANIRASFLALEAEASSPDR